MTRVALGTMPRDDHHVELHVLGCRVDILGTNCKKLLKLKMCVCGGGGGGEGGGGRFSFRTCNHAVSGRKSVIN